jgi:hypothetical protein
MLTTIMMWVSIRVVLLALLGLPVTSEQVVVELVVCASGLLVNINRDGRIRELRKAMETRAPKAVGIWGRSLQTV